MFNWNMRYSGAQDFDGMILWWGSLAGAKVVPGKYSVSLRINENMMETSFNILADPRLDISDQDYREQFEFAQSVNLKVSEAHDAIISIRKLKTQMSTFKNNHDNELVSKKISELDSLLSDIEKTLYQTKNQSGQDPLNFPIRLTNKLAHLNSLNNVGDGRPTQQMLAVRDELTQYIDEQLDRYNAIKKTEIPALNALIKENIDAIIKD